MEPYGFPDCDFRHTRKLNDFIVFSPSLKGSRIKKEFFFTLFKKSNFCLKMSHSTLLRAKRATFTVLNGQKLKCQKWSILASF